MHVKEKICITKLDEREEIIREREGEFGEGGEGRGEERIERGAKKRKYCLRIN